MQCYPFEQNYYVPTKVLSNLSKYLFQILCFSVNVYLLALDTPLCFITTIGTEVLSTWYQARRSRATYYKYQNQTINAVLGKTKLSYIYVLGATAGTYP